MILPAHESITQSTPLGEVAATVTRYEIAISPAQHVPYEGNVAGTRADFPQGFAPSFGSGLAFKGINAAGELELYGLTDRGPNGDGPNVPAEGGTVPGKIFPSPGFHPCVAIIKVGKHGAALGTPMTLKADPNTPYTGLPIAPGEVGHAAEVPLFDEMRFDAATRAVFDARGLDPEAIAVDKRRNALWLADEYGPFLVRVDAASGITQERYGPGTGLPQILQRRRANRGMEAMALDLVTDRIHGVLQSPLSDGQAPYGVTGQMEPVERFARFTRWIEFDPGSGTTTRMFAYPLDPQDWEDGRTGNAKLGDMVALGNGKFIVIEQGAAPGGKVTNKLMLVEIGAASDIGAAPFNPDTSSLERSSMAGHPVDGADWTAVTPLTKTLLLDLNAIGWEAEKAEGLTIVDGATLAIINDNDFGLRTQVFDAAGRVIPDADVTHYDADADGKLQGPAGAHTQAPCATANSVRIARGTDKERPARLWLIRFSRELASY